MKKRILFVLFLVSFTFMNAQMVRPYLGGGAYLHSDFEKSSFLSLRTGAEFKLNRYVKPEIEISGLIGSVETRSILDDNNIMTAEYTRSVSALNFSFCPKIILGNAKELDSYLVLLPRFSISNIEANKRTYTYNSTGTLATEKKETIKEWSQSFSFGIGYSFDLSDENSDSLCLILDLQGVDMGKPLNELSPKASRIDTKWTLGLGLNYYFSLKKKKA
jgi:hypothetical protein